MRSLWPALLHRLGLAQKPIELRVLEIKQPVQTQTVMGTIHPTILSKQVPKHKLKIVHGVPGCQESREASLPNRKAYIHVRHILITGMKH
jgi:hypothetical protein